jgi:hypothetical protein
MNAISDQIEPDIAETIASEARAHGMSVNEYLKNLPARLNGVDLRLRDMEEVHVSNLRARLRTFAEDWDRPEADIYDEDPPR